MSVTSWFLLSGGSTRHRLPREMIFVGRDDCELMLQSRSVDKQHAVINYEPITDEHKVKDLGSLNGTFVNDIRIQEQTYVTLKTDDKLRFGYDTNLFSVMRGEMQVPEEALKHEKFSSQLQLNHQRVVEGGAPRRPDVKEPEGGPAPSGDGGSAATPPEVSREEDKMAAELAALHRGTPLYGQPAWWGDGVNDNRRSGRPEERDRRGERQEIDGREGQPPGEGHPTGGRPPRGEPPCGDPGAGEAAHGHASFTIEFDHGVTGKGALKEQVLKAGPETRPRPRRGVGEDLSPLQTAMMAAEVKVADWLAQNELPLALKEPAAAAEEEEVVEDGESVKSDAPLQQKSLKGSKHEDGTQSDCEVVPGAGPQRGVGAGLLEERSRVPWGGGPGVKIREGRANVPDGLFAEEDSPARRHRYPGAARGASPYEGQAAGAGRAPQRGGASAPCDQGYHHHHHGDDHSDRVTYTIEMENGGREEEEARRMIDRVFGVDEQHESVSVSGLGGDEVQRDRLGGQRAGAPGDRTKAGRMEPEVLSEELMVGGPRWVSQWATLAASHIRTDPEGSGGDSHALHMEDRAEISESSHSASHESAGFSERKRRTLPRLPGDELGRRAPGAGLHSDMGEKQDTEPQEKDPRGRGRAGQGAGGGGGGGGGGGRGGSPKRCSPSRGGDGGGGRGAAASRSKPPRPLSGAEKRLEEAQRRKKEEEKARENAGKPLLRQESFTVERSSSNVPIELIPRIDGPPGGAALQGDGEAVAAFLEAGASEQGDPPSRSIEGSLSPESDVDTTSTVSQADGGRKVVQKQRRTLGAGQRERTVLCSSGRGSSSAGPRGAHERRPKTRAPQKPSQQWTSMDLTDDDVNSTSLLSDSLPAAPAQRGARGQAGGGASVGASTKSSRAKGAPGPNTAANKNAAAPKPRPTRASLLRRARHGDSSDTEPADFDRLSVASEASTASSASRTGLGRRGLSRIEALAQPRRQRVGSPSAQSDSEATVSRSRGLGARSVAGDYAARQGLRGPAAGPPAGTQRARANSASKLPDKAGSRWRRVPVEYASTSEDEYGSNRHASRQGQARTFPSTRVAQLGGSAPATPSPGGGPGLRPHPQDEYMKDWTAHSEEIARISQDLAKDLAMLAREIHDVAGEIDSVNPASEPTPQVEVAAPAVSSSMDDISLVETSGRPVEMRPRGSSGQGSRSIRRQTWNRDDVVLESLLLTSVTQLSARIRQSVDKTAVKIRVLFKDKERKWEDIETKLQAEHDSLLLKSSNKEISSILQDLRRVERQLLAIDVMVDPDGTLDALAELGLTGPLPGPQRSSPGAQGPPGGNGAPGQPYPASERAERDPGLHPQTSDPASREELRHH
ncbi:centrosomal protein of 170 kDa [Gadus chalcogrammus]|uniref:centrosomal protein of 170 kDa n=1 Tax=Gadus chalcogrammus TaxID=1042646 RepID=UPI0024C3AF47|nr:centrosomal protein of 170 kDa [Gadus chalcogrammus]